MERGNISIRNVHLPYRDAQQAAKLYDVFCKDSRVHATASSDENRPSPAWQDSDLDAGGKGILLPAYAIFPSVFFHQMKLTGS